MNSIKNNKNLLSLALIIFIGFSACTKKVPYESLAVSEKEKDVTVSKGDLDSTAVYLYSASQQNASRSAKEAFPYMSGDNKRVKLELTKDVLRIVEIEADDRFAANTQNTKLVLEIPVTHVQYVCKKDKFGECTNTEEDSPDLTWDQKGSIKIKLAEVKSGELQLLPILSSATTGDDCYESVSSRLIRSDIEKDAINFQIEKVFKTKLGCISNDITSLSDATVSAIYHYSLVKASSVLSKNYKTVSYPESSKDEQTFGFFSSSRTKLDVDNNNTVNSKIQIMNRWNPERSKIVYHLSDEFSKPENKLLKDLTFKSVDSINKGLEQAGVKFRIHLNEPSGKVPGDIRNSMIVLVEDPVASSVIGYGPQTEDPVTGEIISARTVMFLGTIKKFAKYTYDEIIREKKSALKSNFTLSPQITKQVETLKKSGKVFGSTAMIESVMAKIDGNTSKESDKLKDSSLRTSSLSFVQPQIQKIIASVKNYSARKNDEYSGNDLKSKILYLQKAKNCAFAPALESSLGGISEKLMAQFPDNAKPWKDLSDSEKEKALALILPEIWIPTLIHELGHNLGLRHNFAASEDKANFYSQQDLEKAGVDHAIPFSSVMDYGNDLKTLPMLGKYDIAALRFGYLRKVAVIEDNKEISVDIPTTLEALSPKLDAAKQTLKNFKFCTDEHTGINAGCKRFDLGTSYVEITQNLIRDYEARYSSRNLRDGQANFSQLSDLTYLSRINSIFRELRVMMEVVERIKYNFKLADNAPEWESIPFLKDLRQAALLSGSFLANVLLVPDIHCAVALSAKPQEIIAVVPIAQIDANAMNCQALSLKPEYTVVGQAGKSLNSKKDPDSTNPYADQIDVRGIWLDKVAAMQTLTARTIEISTMNNNTDNFLNLPEIRNGIVNVIQGLMTNNVVNKLEFTMIDGTKKQYEINYDMNDSQVINHPLIIDMIMGSDLSADQKQRVQRRLGVQSIGTTPLKKIVADTLAANAYDPNRVNTDDKVLEDAVSVYKFSAVSNVSIDNSKKQIVLDGIQYVADTQNVFANQAIENLPLVRLMSQLEEKDLELILNLKLKNQKLPEIPGKDDAEKERLVLMKAVFDKVEAEKIGDFLTGLIKDEKFYQELLQNLPSAN